MKWGSVLSQSFHATNGVRQGGILSPHLFNVYINELSIRLNSQFFGCHINSTCYNHLVYADDTVLLAPSPNADMSDDDHISKEIRNIYARGNMLIRNFKQCTTSVKITLFKTYCSSLYCCPMWIKYCKSTIGKANVAFNKVFKVFMNVPSSFSPSWLFLICDVLNFPPLRRKLIWSFMKRIKKSSNVLISNSGDTYLITWMTNPPMRMKEPR